MTFGRVAPLGDGRFVLVRAQGRATVAVIGSAVSAENVPAQQLLSLPESAPGYVSGMAWRHGEVFLACDEDRMIHVDAKLATRIDEPLDLGGGFRRTINVLVNVPILATEAAVSIPFGVGFGCLAAPFGPLVFLADPGAGLLVMTAPFWFPFVRII
jgi:hypothetical protein